MRSVTFAMLMTMLLALAGCGRSEPAPPDSVVLLEGESADLDLVDWGLLDDWDGDRDGGLVAEEFAGALTARGGWGGWDGDGDQTLDEDELAQMVHGCWDDDSDGVVDQVEWRGGVDRWVGPGSELARFEAWDGDGSGDLTPEEVGAGLRSTFVWDSWDGNRDGRVDEVEFLRGAFTTWDHDADGRVDRAEWDDATRWWR